MTIRREFPHFAAWDAHGMARHLEDMAAKGWHFRGIDWLGRWEYVPEEPKAVRFAIAYAPSRKNWRLTPTEAERDLEDICFDAGWRKVAALSRFHIYRNDDPEATGLETDEAVRLDTLHRSLGTAVLAGALVWSLGGAGLLALFGWALSNDLPRVLAIPMVPFSIVFALWLMGSETVSLILYRCWLRKAQAAAAAGLPCPEIRGWKTASRLNRGFAAVLVLWMLAGGRLPMLLVYGVVLCVFYGLRWLLEHRMHDEALSENLWQGMLVVLFILIFALNCWYMGTQSGDPRTDSIPLMAQHFRDTEGMELAQFDMNGSESMLASYHDYRQADANSDYDLQYTVFDLELPLLEQPCGAWFEEQFDRITERDGLTVMPADPGLWGAEAVLYSEKDGQDQWLIFYDGRTVHLFTSWNMTDAEIAAAAARLAPRKEEAR